ncbi:hypothetical protein Tco_1533010 [Tanacetum coccineum]
MERLDIALEKQTYWQNGASKASQVESLSDDYQFKTLPPQIHKTRVEALKKENIKDENLHGMDKEFENRLDGTLYILRRSWLPHIRSIIILSSFTNGPLWKKASPPMSTTKENKQLRHDLGNHDHQRSYADMRRKPLEFHVEGVSVERSDMF